MPSRYIRHSHSSPSLDDADQLAHQIDKVFNALCITLQKTRKSLGHESRYRGIYVGLEGAALLEHRLSKYALGLNDDLSPQMLSDRGDHILMICLRTPFPGGGRRTPSRASFLETDVGLATLGLIRIIETEEPNLELPFSKYFESCLQIIRDNLDNVGNYDEDSCEVLYGRAGFLYALLRLTNSLSRTAGSEWSTTDQGKALRRSLETLVNAEAVRSVFETIIQIGRVGAKEYRSLARGSESLIPPLMWFWHGKMYLGAAHGVAGILFVLWNSPLSIVERYSDELLGTLDWLITLQDPTGNWPSKVPSDHDNLSVDHELIQWCHGAPGILILLSMVFRQRNGVVLEDQLRERVDQAMRKGAQIVYRHGLLTKGIGICHGVAGSVYALLAVSQALDAVPGGSPLKSTDNDSKYLRKALHLALLAINYEEFIEKGDMRRPDRLWSLYEGAAGMCCAWADILCFFKNCPIYGIPGFSDI